MSLITEVIVDKNVWHKHWVKNNSIEKVKFQIPYGNGLKKTDYYPDNFYLNCSQKFQAEFNGSIELFLKENECVKSLGKEIENGKHTIAITGWLKSGQTFGGFQEITLKN